jgi:hypothetical protein
LQQTTAKSLEQIAIPVPYEGRTMYITDDVRKQKEMTKIRQDKSISIYISRSLLQRMSIATSEHEAML